ncbi:MAG: bifunctional 4-hydroxy-2-oxoglutarate aldolase/2-dehydro-3-deoxy-phosphogluconate aldolase [Christensenellales bacterium]
MLVGAGTVISAEQCETAMNCGAKFVVSPGFDPESVRWCREHALVIIPGCVTPTEIMAAQHAGISVVKFFPANVYGGLKAMKSLSAPFSGIRFVPTGGVNAENAAEYLGAVCRGGRRSWLCTKTIFPPGNFDRIAELAAQAPRWLKKSEPF